MFRNFATGIAAVLALSASAAWAQSQAPAAIAPGNAVLFAQYECDQSQLAKVDQLVTKIAAPTLNKYVADGKLLSWGFTGVYLGGPENRAFYVWAKDPVALVQARQGYLPEIQGKPEFADFARLCPSSTIVIHNLITSATSSGS